MEKCMGMVLSFGLMEASTWVNGQTMQDKVMVSFTPEIATPNMKVCGLMVNTMEKED